MKKIKIKISHWTTAVQGSCYRIDSMVNTASVSLPTDARLYRVGDFIRYEHIDEFARDRRWEVTITEDLS